MTNKFFFFNSLSIIFLFYKWMSVSFSAAVFSSFIFSEPAVS